MFDLLVKAATVIDGSGSVPVTADVGIRDGCIAEVGQLSGAARETLLAEGAWLTPGFVDIHTTTTARRAGTKPFLPASTTA